MTAWRLKRGAGPRPPVELAEEYGLSPFFQELLWRRNIVEREDVDAYIDARLADLVNPELWPQVPAAADFLAGALLGGKTLGVWGDYDVDGITATALVLDVLGHHGFHPLWHIPNRHEEGYGINERGVERLAERGCQVLLSVDSGISDVRAIAKARELGMDVVVSDHHLPPDVLPQADVFFNPRMGEPESVPCPHLAGVGVAFFLMAAVNARLRRATGRFFRMDGVLDLVALGTLADVMRVTGQNRILVRGGLARLTKPRRPGIAALKEISGMHPDAPVTASQVSFKLAPRINAAGRMKHAGAALELLRCSGVEEGRELAATLDMYNEHRRTAERDILVDARRKALKYVEEGAKGLVLYGKDWHPGVIGIVATRIVEEFRVPCIVACDDNDTIKGSGRSVPGFDLYACLAEIPDHIESFGGHKQAAGVRIRLSYIEAFRRDFQEAAARLLPEAAEETIRLDGVLGFRDAANPVHRSEISRMEPFGPGNPEPVFLSNPVEVRGRSHIGSRTDSVALSLRDRADGVTLHAKAWNMADRLGADLVGKTIRVVFTLRSESRYGMMGPELTIKDWGPADAEPEEEDVPPSEDEACGEDG